MAGLDCMCVVVFQIPKLLHFCGLPILAPVIFLSPPHSQRIFKGIWKQADRTHPRRLSALENRGRAAGSEENVCLKICGATLAAFADLIGFSTRSSIWFSTLGGRFLFPARLCAPV